MARILVPYHIDERLDDLDIPLVSDLSVALDDAGGTGETGGAEDAGDPWATLAALYEQVAKLVAADVERGARPIVISGDCTTSLGTVAGLQRAGLDPSIVWFDGHGDVQTPETTTSGYLGGYPLRLLVGYRPELIARSLGLRSVPEHRVTLVDARDLDPPEAEYLRAAQIQRRDVHGLTPDTLPEGPIYLHLDVDVADAAQVPGLRYPVPGGPTLDATAAALRVVLGTGRVAAFGLACTWHPGQSGAAAVEAIRARLAGVLAGWE